MYLSPAPPTDAPEPANTAVIIGVVVAVVIVILLLILVVFVIVLLYIRHKDTSESQRGQGETRRSMRGGKNVVVVLCTCLHSGCG